VAERIRAKEPEVAHKTLGFMKGGATSEDCSGSPSAGFKADAAISAEGDHTISQYTGMTASSGCQQRRNYHRPDPQWIADYERVNAGPTRGRLRLISGSD
jgi:hypothetical protein